MNFTEGDVVRHALVQRIVRAYERYNELTGTGRQLALKLGPDAAPEPADPPANTQVETPEFPSLS